MDSKSLRFITHQSFFSAVRSGDLESLKRFIEDEGSDHPSLMALQNDSGETALYIAAENNFQEMFSYLLKFCDLQIAMIRSKSDFHPFHVAAKRGHLGQYSSLFDFDFDFDFDLHLLSFESLSFHCIYAYGFCIMFSILFAFNWHLLIFFKSFHCIYAYGFCIMFSILFAFNWHLLIFFKSFHCIYAYGFCIMFSILFAFNLHLLIFFFFKSFHCIYAYGFCIAFSISSVTIVN
ncbi:hypothetical protein CsSME_00043164 [Camellia sinensis var. sinensis]